jgi:hypothetical protein
MSQTEHPAIVVKDGELADNNFILDKDVVTLGVMTFVILSFHKGKFPDSTSPSSVSTKMRQLSKIYKAKMAHG